MTGFLLDPTDTEGFARRVRQILRTGTRERLGRAGKEHVRQHFLITRLLSDYLDMLNEGSYPERMMSGSAILKIISEEGACAQAPSSSTHSGDDYFLPGTG